MSRQAPAVEPTRWAVALLFSLIVFAVVVFKVQYDVIADADTFWHIKTGVWIIDNMQFPHVDMFSHSYLGEPWIAKEWLSQVIFYGAYKLAGWKGVLLLTASAIFATVWILSRFCLSRFRWSGAVGAMFVLVLFASGHFLARPLILAFPVMLIWTIELANAADERRLPRWWMIPLMVLWVNLHGGFTLGLLLAGIFSAETVLSAKMRDWLSLGLKHAAFLAALFLATLINPYGFEALLITQKILDLSAPLKTLNEWQSPDFQSRRYHLFVLMGLLAITLLSGFQLRKFRLVALLLLAFLMFTYTRSMSTFGLLLPIIVASSVNQQFPASQAQVESKDWRDDGVFSWFVRHARKLNVMSAVFACLIAIGVVSMNDFDLNQKRHPYGGVEFARKTGIQGNVLNDYVHGGYLIFMGIATGIDGRAELYGNTFYQRYANAVFNPGLEDTFAFLDELNISWTLLRTGSAVVPLLDLSPDWRCVYDKDGITIHLRTSEQRNAGVSGSCDKSD